MNVSGYATDDEAHWTAPYPTGTFGAKLRLLRGDMMRPDLTDARMRPGRESEKPNWFNCIPVRIERTKISCRPFISLGFYRFGVYVGWKVYGVDSDAYLDYPGVMLKDVYTGSRAVVLSARFTLKREVINT